MSNPNTSSTNTSNDNVDDDDLPLVLQDLRRFLKTSEDRSNADLFDKSATAMPVAAIKALLGVVERSKANTMMGLQRELKQASQIMMEAASGKVVKRDGSLETHTNSRHIFPTTNTRSHSIAVSSGCELFMKYVTRTFLEVSN